MTIIGTIRAVVSSATGLVVVLAAADARAQTSLRPTTEVQVRGLVFGNFFQASEEAPKRQVGAMRFDWLGAVPVDHAGRWRVYADADLITYDSFDPSPGLRGGIRLAGPSHTLDVTSGFEWQRPTVDIGDTFGQANLLSVSADYGYRIHRDLDLLASADFDHHDFAVGVLEDAADHAVGGGVRLRGFGRRFSPSLAFEWGGRRSRGDEDFAQRDIVALVRSSIDRMALRVQYRHRLRDYEIEQLPSRNFGREDTRRRLSVSADFPMVKRLFGLVSYQLEHASSTRADRNFFTQMFQAGLALRLDVGEHGQPDEGRH